MQKKKCGESWIYTEERLKWARSIAIGGAIKEMCFVFKVYIKELEIDLGRATIHKLQFYTLVFSLPEESFAREPSLMYTRKKNS